MDALQRKWHALRLLAYQPLHLERQQQQSAIVAALHLWPLCLQLPLHRQYRIHISCANGRGE
eukprot:529088-Amphidinium_carterae.1